MIHCSKSSLFFNKSHVTRKNKRAKISLYICPTSTAYTHGQMVDTELTRLERALYFGNVVRKVIQNRNVPMKNAKINAIFRSVPCVELKKVGPRGFGIIYVGLN